MAARRTQTTQLNIDAQEFGVGVRCGGWRLGLLVARNVEPGKAGKPSAANRSLENNKVSMNKFAELAGVSVSHVKYYYDAWELAAKANLVPAASKVEYGDDEICIDVDAIEDEDNPRTFWSWFYSNAKNPPKQKEEKKKVEKKEPEISSSTDEDEDDSDDDVDDDFGIQSFTKEEAAEADSSIQRGELLEVLESLRVMQSKLESAGVAKGSNGDIYNQIASLALDLSTAATAMTVTEEEKENV